MGKYPIGGIGWKQEGLNLWGSKIFLKYEERNSTIDVLSGNSRVYRR